MALFLQIRKNAMPRTNYANAGQLIAFFSWLFVILTVSTSAGADYKCTHLFRARYKFEFDDPRENGVSLLGEGEFGKVELKLDSKSHFFAFKTYKKTGANPQAQLISDFRAFKFLSNHKYRFSFNLPRVDKVSSHELSMDYYPGRTVADLNQDDQVKPEVKSQVKIKYENLVHEIKELLVDQEFEIDEKIDAGLSRVSAFNDSYSMGRIDFIIKPDNVIVDPETLKLTLIDPY